MNRRIVPKSDTLATARIVGGKTQAKLAAEAGLPRTTISRAELGKSIGAQAATQICAALGKPFEELFSIEKA